MRYKYFITMHEGSSQIVWHFGTLSVITSLRPLPWKSPPHHRQINLAASKFAGRWLDRSRLTKASSSAERPTPCSMHSSTSPCKGPRFFRIGCCPPATGSTPRPRSADWLVRTFSIHAIKSPIFQSPWTIQRIRHLQAPSTRVDSATQIISAAKGPFTKTYLTIHQNPILPTPHSLLQ